MDAGSSLHYLAHSRSSSCANLQPNCRSQTKLLPLGQPSSAYIQEKSLTEAGLEVLADLGQGSQSSLHLAWKAREGTYRCVKRFHKRTMSGDAIPCMMREYQTMKVVEMHRNIGKVYDLFQESDFFHIEMELHEGGDFTTLKARAMSAGISLTEAWWNNVLWQCLEALRFVHSKGFVHCDVKEPNFMLKNMDYNTPSVVLIDFGVAQEEGLASTPAFGTPGYVPPEVWRTHKWEGKGDVFSLGVTMLQVLIDRIPSQKDPKNGIFVENTNDLNSIATATQTREPPMHLIPPCYPNLQAAVRQLLLKDLEERPSALEAQGLVLREWLSWPTMFESPPVSSSSAPVLNSTNVSNSSNDHIGFGAYAAVSAFFPIMLLVLL